MLHDVFSAQSTRACSWHMPDLHRPDDALIWWADVRHNNDKISSLHQIPSLEQGKSAVNIGVGVCVQVHAEGYDAPSQIQSLPCVLLVCTYTSPCQPVQMHPAVMPDVLPDVRGMVKGLSNVPLR